MECSEKERWILRMLLEDKDDNHKTEMELVVVVGEYATVFYMLEDSDMFDRLSLLLIQDNQVVLDACELQDEKGNRFYAVATSLSAKAARWLAEELEVVPYG